MALTNEQLQRLEAAATEVLTGKLTIFEVFALLEVIGGIAKEVSPLHTKEEYLAVLNQAWEYADENFKIVDKLDDALKFPIWAAPLELGDGTAIRLVITGVALPQLAEKLAGLEG